MSSWFWDDCGGMSDFQQEYVAAFLDGKMPDLMNEIMETAEKFNNDVCKSDIPNTEYITINANGIFVGGKPATHYRGEEIQSSDFAISIFGSIQREINPNVQELHVLSSETRGHRAQTGKPSAKHGENAWYRVKFNDGTSDWVFLSSQGSGPSCARICAYICADDARYSHQFLPVISPSKSEKPEETLSACERIKRFFDKKSTEIQK
ncbi:MAG: hypothetical protein J6Y07_02795 [Alphaproteobacteria bacterium]|nr:hypothetical protein [Alphaproteobacteria bacterium]